MSDSEDDYNENQLKVVILGDQNVGKTNVVKRICYDDFSRIYVPTVGADFYIKRINLSGKREINVRITDVSGMELKGHMLATYLFNVNVSVCNEVKLFGESARDKSKGIYTGLITTFEMVILVYDITNSDSFDSLIIWLREVDRIMESSGEASSIVVSIFGNKGDLEHKRAVRLDKTNHFIHDNKLTNYFVSAKTGENVNSAFTELIARYYNVPLSRIEKEKQNSIVKAELIPNTPPVPVFGKAKIPTSNNISKQNNLKKTSKKNKVQKNNDSTSCIIQ